MKFQSQDIFLCADSQSTQEYFFGKCSYILQFFFGYILCNNSGVLTKSQLLW